MLTSQSGTSGSMSTTTCGSPPKITVGQPSRSLPSHCVRSVLRAASALLITTVMLPSASSFSPWSRQATLSTPALPAFCRSWPMNTFGEPVMIAPSDRTARPDRCTCRRGLPRRLRPSPRQSGSARCRPWRRPGTRPAARRRSPRARTRGSRRCDPARRSASLLPTADIVVSPPVSWTSVRRRPSRSRRCDRRSA